MSRIPITLAAALALLAAFLALPAADASASPVDFGALADCTEQFWVDAGFCPTPDPVTPTQPQSAPASGLDDHPWFASGTFDCNDLSDYSFLVAACTEVGDVRR